MNKTAYINGFVTTVLEKRAMGGHIMERSLLSLPAAAGLGVGMLGGGGLGYALSPEQATQDELIRNVLIGGGIGGTAGLAGGAGVAGLMELQDRNWDLQRQVGDLSDLRDLPAQARQDMRDALSPNNFLDRLEDAARELRRREGIVPPPGSLPRGPERGSGKHKYRTVPDGPPRKV